MKVNEGGVLGRHGHINFVARKIRRIAQRSAGDNEFKIKSVGDSGILIAHRDNLAGYERRVVDEIIVGVGDLTFNADIVAGVGQKGAVVIYRKMYLKSSAYDARDWREQDKSWGGRHIKRMGAGVVLQAAIDTRARDDGHIQRDAQ